MIRMMHYSGPRNLHSHEARVPYTTVMKKTYTATFKAQVVLELLKETKTLNQLASEYAIAPTVLREWRQAMLKGLPDVFTKGDSVTDLKATHERQLEDLYAEIGRLTTHVNFLKKKLPS